MAGRRRRRPVGDTGRAHRALAHHRGDPHVPCARTARPLRRRPPVVRHRDLGRALRPRAHLLGRIRAPARGPVRGTRAGLAAATELLARAGLRRRWDSVQTSSSPPAITGRASSTPPGAVRGRADPGRRRGTSEGARHQRPGRRPAHRSACCRRVRNRLARRRGCPDPRPVPRSQGPLGARPGAPQGAPRPTSARRRRSGSRPAATCTSRSSRRPPASARRSACWSRS